MIGIIASNISNDVGEKDVEKFFSFCGTITHFELIEKGDKTKKYKIYFRQEKALSTALLLNDAELKATPVKVETLGQGPELEKPEEQETQEKTDHKVQDDDVSQEEKPKYAIMAQLLASGYTLSDKLIQRSIDFDKKHGVSGNFKTFLTRLDQKYIHSQDADSPAAKGLSKAQSTWKEWYEKFQKSPYFARLSYYFDMAANNPYGVKIHDFYRNLVTEVDDVHKEAQRLVEMRRKKEIEDHISNANAAAAVNSVN